MSLKEQLLSILAYSRETEQGFAEGLSGDERGEVGTYERWSASDALAHVAHWKAHRAGVLTALASGAEPAESEPNLEQANRACFDRYCNCSWDEVQAYAEESHAQLVGAVRALPEDALSQPFPGGRHQPVWRDALGTGYTHVQLHMAEYYTARGRADKAGELWQAWGERVAPLDDDPEWQGLVHYNVACGLALGGNPEAAVEELRQAIELRPSITTWSRQDPDLSSLRDLDAYKELYAPAFWWKAIEANPQAEAMADQFMRALGMIRGAIKAFPAEEWRKGDTPYQRPAGLAVHALESTDSYTALNTAQSAERGDLGVDWGVADSSKLPSQEKVLAYLDEVEQHVAEFLADADLGAAEELFRWTGSTLLSRAAYTVRHLQHHLAEMCLELHRRGIEAPGWQ
jgi:tetratricopeptide (TPR) repeat protein